MNTRTFFSNLLAVSGAMGVLLALFHYFFPPAHPHWKLAAGSVVLFAAICAGLFFAGLSAVKGNNKYAFNNLISACVFGKLVVSVGFLFLYQKAAMPASEWYVAIFLTVYVVFTVFEVWFMTKLARM